MDLDLLDLFEILGEVLDGLDFSGGSATDLGSPPPEQIARLDEASKTTPAYPYFPYYRQEGFARINPPIV